MKIWKRILIVVGIIALFFIGILFYIGNYLYDYTLNPHSTHYITEKLDMEESIFLKSRQWLEETSEDVYLMSKDHLKLHSYLIEQNSSTYIIMVHGYRSEGAGIMGPIKKFQKAGYSLLIPDLRGHGQSEGDYIGMGWDERLDILDWIDYLIQRNENITIILYGISMGGATVMNAAGENLPSQVKAVIEDCGYTSVWDVFKAHIDMNDMESEIALRMASLVTLIRAGYRLEDASPLLQVQNCHIPILFIHGSKDDFVPCEMVDELYDAAHMPKEKLIIEGAGHADCSSDKTRYYQTIFAFIEKYN